MDNDDQMMNVCWSLTSGKIMYGIERKVKRACYMKGRFTLLRGSWALRPQPRWFWVAEADPFTNSPRECPSWCGGHHIRGRARWIRGLQRLSQWQLAPLSFPGTPTLPQTPMLNCSMWSKITENCDPSWGSGRCISYGVACRYQWRSWPFAMSRFL